MVKVNAIQNKVIREKLYVQDHTGHIDAKEDFVGGQGAISGEDNKRRGA